MYFHKGKVAIITGAVYGIGNAFAHGLARAGYDISICDIRPEVEPVAKGIETEYGHRVLGLKADVSKADDVRRVVDRTLADFGRIDVVVSNVGIWKATSPTDSWDQGLTDWDDLIGTNLKSGFSRQ
ncbi:SDR family NAD(P)-dependent oxidoreductase [Thermodesulfobacteriota bacterium]